MSKPEYPDGAEIARHAFAVGLHPNALVRTLFAAEQSIAEQLTEARAAAARANLAVTCLELALHYCRQSEQSVFESPLFGRRP